MARSGRNGKTTVWGHRFTLFQAIKDAEEAGGLDKVRERYNKYSLQRRQFRKKEREEKGTGKAPDADLAGAASIHETILKQRAAIRSKESSPSAPHDVIEGDSFVNCKRLRYCKDRNLAKVDGLPVPLQTNPTTAKFRGKTRKITKRLQLNKEVVATLNSPRIGEHSGEVTDVKFPNGLENVVIKCRRDSSDSALRDFHSFMMDGEGRRFDELLDQLPNWCWKLDALGGGRYHPVGHSTRGCPNGMPTGQAFLRETAKNEHSVEISRLLGKAFSLIARILSKHCPEVLEENDQFRQMNSNAAWPTYAMQDTMWHIFCSQIAIRRWGGPKYAQTRDEAMTSLHWDSGDVDTRLPLFYRPGGGVGDLGGPVEDTDLQLFEDENGGASVTVETCIRDTIVIIVKNARRQLHGVVKSSPQFQSDGTCWSTRFVPLFSMGVWYWMRREEPTRKPWRYPECRKFPWESRQYNLPWPVLGTES